MNKSFSVANGKISTNAGLVQLNVPKRRYEEAEAETAAAASKTAKIKVETRAI